MDHAFTGLGDALRDPQTKDSLSKAAKSLSDALDATFSGIGQKLRQKSSKDSPGPSPTEDPGTKDP
jgi:hypothetical protein